MKLYSHIFENGSRFELKRHLENVGRISVDLISEKKLSFTLSQEIIEQISYLIGICHDIGKATSFFQTERLGKNIKSEKTEHSKLSAICGYVIIKQYLENVEISNNWKLFLRLAIPYIIERHHSSLGDVEHLKNIKTEFIEYLIKNLEPDIFGYEFNYKDLTVSFKHIKSELDDMKTLSEKLRKDYRKFVKICGNELDETKIERAILLLLLFSVLMETDKAKLILDEEEYDKESEDLELQSDIVDKYKKGNFEYPPREINESREYAYRDVISKIDKCDLLNSRIYSITLPTGTGKTLTSLSFALKLRNRIKRELEYTPKIIYSLPFLSIIEQTDDVFKDVLKSEIVKYTENIDSNNRVLLKHHSLSDIEYGMKIGNEELDINKSEFLINIWNSEIILTTFDQVLYSAFSRNRAFIMRFHNLFNSILIFDEVQSIPYKLWALIREFFKVLSKVGNTYLILMTATKPMIFKENEEILELVADVDSYFKKFDRVKLHSQVETLISFDDYKREILKTIQRNPERDIMIVLNTIESSINMYKFLTSKKEISNRKFYYLSSNVIPKDRIARIQKMKDKVDKKNKVIVTTQCIEAGVDIDVDIIFRDFAPLDSINQVCGRCNRHNRKEKGEVCVHRVKSNAGKEFSNFIYRDNCSNIRLDATRKLLPLGVIDEPQFLGLNREYFTEINKRKADFKSILILDNFCKLKFSEWDIRKELRGDDFKEVVFVIKDDESKRIFDEYKRIMGLKDWKNRREGILEIRKNLAENSVSITVYNGVIKRGDEKYQLNQIVSEYGGNKFYYIENEYYDKEIGFDPAKSSPAKYIF